MNGLSNEGDYGDMHWEMKLFKGDWIVGKNAGGCGNDELFWTNPQHQFSIKGQNLSVLVSIGQEGISKKRFQTQGQFVGMHEAIGFYIYAIRQGAQADNEGRYEKTNLQLFNYTKVFKYQKEVSLRMNIPPGDYVLFPCTFKRDRPGSYVVRVYMQTDKQDDLEKNDNDNFPDDANPILDDRDPYDKLYFRGMDKQQIEELNKQAQENVSRACMIM